ncbi:MAG: glycoside hydrolase family 3 C-terminal domain-containing protein [Lachnospiraceae bacterium]|nr:glycoside hydrolase family 3 C-terminal domain-containing protein [Lachnospiraceae bacterium]
MEDFKKTPLWDSRLPIKERLDYLLSEMTMDEKLSCLGTGTPALPRFGTGEQFIGSEAAHGVEARHDQGHKREPEPTTSFPQPIGMSASWDPDLLCEAGEVVGKEARVLYQRNPVGGLFRWAPTVDMERDPRWGRTEEGYGEDPYLTGKMAGAYVRGMQGSRRQLTTLAASDNSLDDSKDAEMAGKKEPEHLLISSALKHFEANNVEEGRGIKSSGLDAANRQDYYYEPFRRVIEEAGATSLMTSYNAVNGVTSILDHRVNELIREKWGLSGHVVSDGGALGMELNARHETKSHAESLALALKAGVDCMTDEREMVEQAAREAYAAGMITEEEIDQALRHSFGTKLRLGLYDAWDANPWNHVDESVMRSDAHNRVSLRLAEESLVLLKNDGLLPLSEDAKVCVIGPVADQWYQDWYGGEPNWRTTVLDGVRALTGCEAPTERGLDLVLLRVKGCGECVFAKETASGESALPKEAAARASGAPQEEAALYAYFNEKNQLAVTADRGQAEPIYIQDWGDNSITLFVPRLKKYICVQDDGLLSAEQEIPFGWFVHECFHWGADEADPAKEDRQKGSGSAASGSRNTASGKELVTWYGAKLVVRSDGLLSAVKTVFEHGIGVPQTEALEGEENREAGDDAAFFAAEVLENGLARARKLAAESEAVILALGNCPVINGKEDADRPSIQFPWQQRELAQAVFAANPNTVLVLYANYPYAIDWEQANLPAILQTATGSQDFGTAVANALFGRCAPAGRLNMTWYPGDALLPDKDDYDIRKTRRTYRFYDQKPLYPFGHGLTYGAFTYEDLSIKLLSLNEIGQPGAAKMGEAAVCAEETLAAPEMERTAALELIIQLRIMNHGTRTSDEVVQIYLRDPESRIHKPVRRLIAFRREHDVRPGETRELTFAVPRSDLRVYDVARADFIVEEGVYRIEAGTSSGDIRLQKEIFIPGDKGMPRPRGQFVSVDHWDEYENLVLGKGPDTGKQGGSESCSASVKNSVSAGMCSQAALPGQGWARYEGVNAAGETIRLSVVAAAEKEGSFRVVSGGSEAARWDSKASAGREKADRNHTDTGCADTNLTSAEAAPVNLGITGCAFTDSFSAEYWGRFTSGFQTISLELVPSGDDLTFYIEGDLRLAGFMVENRR